MENKTGIIQNKLYTSRTEITFYNENLKTYKINTQEKSL